MADLTKAELLELLLKLLKTRGDMNFLMSLEEKDLTTLLVALRERIEHTKQVRECEVDCCVGKDKGGKY